jgi:hypothetical protein
MWKLLNFFKSKRKSANIAVSYRRTGWVDDEGYAHFNEGSGTLEYIDKSESAYKPQDFTELNKLHQEIQMLLDSK